MSRPRLILAMALLVSLGWGATWAFEGWRDRAELAEARRAMAREDYDEAHTLLARLARRRPDDGEVAYGLGLSAERIGRHEEALAAWGRVGKGSPFLGKSALLRGKLAFARGRFGLAEESLRTALAAHGPQRPEARATLKQLMYDQGRMDEVRALIRAEFRDSDKPADVLYEHWAIDSSPIPFTMIGEVLDQAARLAPDDDRIWLGRANQAIASGRFAEAADWLDGCLSRRPEDPAVWRARLELARASGDLPMARLALTHLPTSAVEPTDLPALGAWLAGQQGDRRAECAALEERIRRKPDDVRALARLADLATEAGDHGRAAALRRRETQIDTTWERYRVALGTGRLDQALEYARLAEILGRRFEARGWASLARASHPDDASALIRRLDRTAKPPNPVGRTLADHFPAIPNTPAARPTPPGTASVPIPQFRDDAESAGLHFSFESGKSALRQLPETMSGGVALLDYDGDGHLDVYALQGGPFPPPPDAEAPGDRLFRNRGDGTFEDRTAAAGLGGGRGYGHGVAVGDIDNDGHPDLLVTRWRAYALYHNKGDGTFADVTAAAGLGGDRDWPTSAAFADLDGDGDLDLYVCHYLKWDELNPKKCTDGKTPTRHYCDPRLLEPLPDHVFRNDGGHFVDLTTEAGIAEYEGRGLGAVAADLDGDGRVDLFVANDTSANFYFHNLGGFRFRNEAQESGLAASSLGGYQAGMGVACGDLDGDGRPDLAVTNFYGESTTLYQNLGAGLFADRTAAVGLAAPSRFLLGFGAAFLDANNDGMLDLLTANGHVNTFTSHPYAMPAQLLLGIGGGRLRDVTARTGEPFQVARVGRGLAVGDLDDDGRLDALIVAQNQPLAYVHNQAKATGHWLTLRLEGTTSNRDAVGAHVAITAGGQTRHAWRLGGGSYQSASDGRLHFGLGPESVASTVEVTWPSGHIDVFKNVKADRVYRLKEGQAEAECLARGR